VNSATIVRIIEASPDAAFAAFIEPDQLALWWGPDDGPVLSVEIDPRVGGKFHIRFRLAEDGTEHGSSGVFEVFDRPRRLAMSWSWDDDAGPASHVDVTFRQVERGTEVTLVHSRLPDAEQRDQHQHGWTGAFEKLAQSVKKFGR
jgi:uncharacterized protein YndB with AHSA1/START domain